MTGDQERSEPSAVVSFFRTLSQRYQRLLDIWTPYPVPRWVATVALCILFMLRIVFAQGWYIICYALGIYHLNLFIAFLTPKIDPAMSDDLDDGGPELPTRGDEEFRPFIRRLPEFKFWYSATKATIVALVCTMFEAFNIPVFWPILLLYFITLFGLTMKRQIKHMIKYRYLPWSHGKTRYQPKAPVSAAAAGDGKSFVSNAPELSGIEQL